MSVVGQDERARRGPGRPRESGHDGRIMQAALALIDNDQPVTVNAVVAASGVSRAALYRRWPSMTDLIAAALDHGRSYASISTEGNIKQNIIDAMFHRVPDTRGAAYPERRLRRRLALGLADRDLQLSLWRSHVGRRRTAMVEVLRAGIERGVLRPDTDIEASIDLMNGVFYYQIVVRGCVFDDPRAMARCREAFETVWRGMVVPRAA